MLVPTTSVVEMSGHSASAAAGAPRAEIDQHVLAVFDQFLRANRDDALVWVASGFLWADYTVNAGPDGSSPAARSNVLGAILRPDRVARFLLGAGRFRERYWTSGDAIVVANTLNQRRAVAPLSVDAPVDDARAPVVPLARLLSTGRRHAQEIGDGLRRAGVGFPGGSRSLHGLFLTAALHLAYARRLVAHRSPSVVVVASNHDVAARACVCAAQENGVPSVLVPHAPMLGDLHLRDAPTDYVAVRGDREAAWYLEQGAEADQVAVVGNPALQPEPELVAIPAGAPIVFAPSPYDDPVVAEQVALIAAATDVDVVVAPHPRQRLEFLQDIAPRHWAFHEGQTYARLRGGATAVVQSSSGVALESLLLGIPVIEIEPAGGRLYPFIQTDLVPSAGTAEELGGQLELTRTRIADPEYRKRLAAYARSWCSTGGETAAENVRRFVRFAAAQGKRPRPAYDAWRPRDRDGA